MAVSTSREASLIAKISTITSRQQINHARLYKIDPPNEFVFLPFSIPSQSPETVA
jgi:hypothetical protein